MAASSSGRMKGGIRRLDACVLTVNLTIPLQVPPILLRQRSHFS